VYVVTNDAMISLVSSPKVLDSCVHNFGSISRIDLLVFNHLFILRAVSIKFDLLEPLGLSSVKPEFLLDWLGMNGLLGKIESQCKTSEIG
jgi:hypothetical protein